MKKLAAIMTMAVAMAALFSVAAYAGPVLQWTVVRNAKIVSVQNSDLTYEAGGKQTTVDVVPNIFTSDIPKETTLYLNERGEVAGYDGLDSNPNGWIETVMSVPYGRLTIQKSMVDILYADASSNPYMQVRLLDFNGNIANVLPSKELADKAMSLITSHKSENAILIWDRLHGAFAIGPDGEDTLYVSYYN